MPLNPYEAPATSNDPPPARKIFWGWRCVCALVTSPVAFGLNVAVFNYHPLGPLGPPSLPYAMAMLFLWIITIASLFYALYCGTEWLNSRFQR